MIVIPMDTLLTYRWAADQVSRYEIRVEFDGYLPIFGGRNATSNVQLELEVKGKDAQSVTYRVTEFSMKLDETPMSFNAKNIQGFFPPADVTFAATGEVRETTAPKTKLPFRLPGLDPQRLPEISFAPIVFPSKPVNEGTAWTYEKVLNGAKTEYRVRVESLRDNEAVISGEIAQRTTFGEDASGAVVALEAASRTVQSETLGKATAVFSIDEGKLVRAEIAATTQDVPSDGTPTRTLKTTIQVKRK
ncbi:MAG: hypothetical protein SFX74_01450 [Fimbriimonadaceae bacterium]|nr:hypothetical protein [Fimbriimonadaceae bacterium]